MLYYLKRAPALGLTFGGNCAKSASRLVKYHLHAKKEILSHRPLIPIKALEDESGTDIDRHWARYTIQAAGTPHFTSRRESLAYAKKIDALYPFYFEYCDLYDPHPGQVILEYGCGPGNDLIGWVEHARAKKIYGLDISLKALAQARDRLCLHPVLEGLVELIQVSDRDPVIPLPDGSVDYINCLGVLHHTSHPLEILKEFHRVLKKGGRAKIMVYHRHSLSVHLVIGYVAQVLKGKCPGLTAEEAYGRISDGEAPRSDVYSVDEFLNLARQAGFTAQSRGIGFERSEMEYWRRYGQKALSDNRLHSASQQFLKEIQINADGYPTHRGIHAGINAVFDLEKA